jgi:hypothetical protein
MGAYWRTLRAMASQKTLPSDESAEAFIAAVPDDRRRADAEKLSGLLREWTGEPAAMWGASIVGFGRYDYRYDSGHEGTALVIYLVGGVEDRYPKLLEKLGPHTLGKGCLYVKRLDDVDHDTLRALVDRTVRVHRGADRRASAS